MFSFRKRRKRAILCECVRNSCGALVRWAVCCWHAQEYSTSMQKSMSIFYALSLAGLMYVIFMKFHTRRTIACVFFSIDSVVDRTTHVDRLPYRIRKHLRWKSDMKAVGPAEMAAAIYRQRWRDDENDLSTFLFSCVILACGLLLALHYRRPMSIR